MTARSTFILALLLSLLTVTAARSQSSEAENEGGDPEIRRQLEELGLNYLVDDDGDFRLHFDTGGDRSQIVLIKSEPYEVGAARFREISSVARAEDVLSDYGKRFMADLLEQNFMYKIGGWQIFGGSSPYLLQFAVRIDADAPAAVLRESLAMVSREADEMEASVSDEDDY